MESKVGPSRYTQAGGKESTGAFITVKLPEHRRLAALRLKGLLSFGT